MVVPSVETDFVSDFRRQDYRLDFIFTFFQVHFLSISHLDHPLHTGQYPADKMQTGCCLVLSDPSLELLQKIVLKKYVRNIPV